MSASLLDDLAEKEGVFISDLKNQALFVDIVTILGSLDLQQYSLAEWNDGLSYIFATPLVFTDYAQIHKFLDGHTPKS